MNKDKMGQIGEKKGEELLYSYFKAELPLFSVSWMSIKSSSKSWFPDITSYIANIILEILNKTGGFSRIVNQCYCFRYLS
ncbi:hypothetical protein ES708_25714 [subsurface metagenome]